MIVKRHRIAFFFAAICILEASTFTFRIKNNIQTQQGCVKKSWTSHGLQGRASDDCDENESTRESGIPQLPAIGSSSFQSSGGGLPPTVQQEKGNDSQTAFVSPKFQLQYTCKVCNTRNCHLVSRIGTLIDEAKEKEINNIAYSTFFLLFQCLSFFFCHNSIQRGRRHCNMQGM